MRWSDMFKIALQYWSTLCVLIALALAMVIFANVDYNQPNQTKETTMETKHKELLEVYKKRIDAAFLYMEGCLRQFDEAGDVTALARSAEAFRQSIDDAVDDAVAAVCNYARDADIADNSSNTNN